MHGPRWAIHALRQTWSTRRSQALPPVIGIDDPSKSPGRPLTKASWSRSHIYKPLLKLAPALPACPEPKGRLAARPRAASLRVRPSEAAPLQLFAGLLAAPLDLRQQREAAYRA